MALFPEDFEKKLAQNGLELLKYSSFHSRQDVVDFYRKIDIQAVWRPWPKALSNPLKIVNAASFGIPTLAYPEVAFAEVGECYIPVETLDEFIKQVKRLKSSPSLYARYRDRCLAKAEAYHIERVAEIYKHLE
jgi:glycosyltransferase involved in cell wall biosynthesis